MANPSTTQSPCGRHLACLVRDHLNASSKSIDETKSKAELAKAQDAFATLHDQFSGLILSYLAARAKSRSDTVELAQESWLKIWKALPDKFDGDNFRAWAFRIAYTTLVDHTRKKKPVLSPTATELSIAPVIENNHEEIEQLRNCISKLDDERRTVVECLTSGMSHQAISDQFAVPLKTIHTRYHRAKGQLAECMKQALS